MSKGKDGKAELTVVHEPLASRLQDLVGPSAFIQGEDAELYRELSGRVRAEVAPTDVIEELWTGDLIALFWEGVRLRRLKDTYVKAVSSESLRLLLGTLTGRIDNRELARGWFLREKASVMEVEKLFAKSDLSTEAITAISLASKADIFDRFDRMIMQNEGRQRLILREIDRRREAAAARRRQAMRDIDGLVGQLPSPSGVK